jgi:hypothetical protein
VARFDRNDVPLGENVTVGVEQADVGIATTDVKVKGKGTSAVDVVHPEGKRQQFEEPVQKALGVSDVQDGVRVGEVLVRLGGQRETVEGMAGQAKGDAVKEQDALAKEKCSRMYVRSYKAVPEDVDWARCGVVATVAKGEAPSVLRRRLEDAGFKALDLIHLGGDRVLVRSQEGADVLAVFDSAKDFFQL